MSLLSDNDDTDGSDVIISDENESALWTAVNVEMNQECSSKVCETTNTGHQSSLESVTDTEQSLLGNSTECLCESSSLHSLTVPVSLDQPLTENSTVHLSTACELLCCHSLNKPYQPRDHKSLVQGISVVIRYVLPSKKFFAITVSVLTTLYTPFQQQRRRYLYN